MLYRTNAEAIRPLHEWAATFERYWRHQLIRASRSAPKNATQSRRRNDVRTGSDTSTISRSPSRRRSTSALRSQHAFEALLEEMGPANVTHEGAPMPMKIEPWPGGRWFRDLGDDNGHLWGHVQAIKKYTLLEISGPLFMSNAVFNNLQYRLKEVDGGTLITLRHTALGFIPDDYKAGLDARMDAAARTREEARRISQCRSDSGGHS